FNSGGQPSILLQCDKGPLLLEPSGYFEKQFLTVDELLINNQSNEIDERVLLFQTGYLTIKESRNGSLRLGYPNREVANSMASLCLSCYLKEKNLAQIKAMDIPFFLAKGEVEAFVKCVNSAFLALDYERCFITNIKECLSAFLLVLQGSNLQAKTEVHKGLRRSTFEFTVENKHWVIELKFARKKSEHSRLLEEGLQQVKSRHYGEENLDGELIRLVMVFSEKERQFVRYSFVEVAKK
ncbi:MAG: PD-(D/E)XK nuclease domain-containing protein, partial [Burkholderiales bacterium]|nr:PD-(D/E)XK nuclease domain-containing protein [Burkholderiales bacterium]